MEVLVDTNVILRVVEPKHSHHTKAVDALRSLSRMGHSLCLVPQVHYEFWVAATRPIALNGLSMTCQEAEEELGKMGPPLFRFLRDERAVYDSWCDLVTHYSIQGKSAHDARLVAAMKRHGLTHILTFNVQDFKRYSEIEVLDPMEVGIR